jgi:tetratricopeptide (TPR) repeat protein
MGTVYAAEQRDAGRRVALKMVHGGGLVDEETRGLFRREIRALARLEHPGIASLYTSGTTPDGVPFFSMELVDGMPLDAWGRARSGPGAFSDAEVRRRVAVFVRVCDAVAYAHGRGVIHRDLKPSNVFVREVDGEDEVKVLDFGLARITEPDGSRLSRVTEHGTLRGTVPYMSPEQLAGDPDLVDARSDVYALGVLLYELLTAQHPHGAAGAPPFELPGRILREPPVPISRSWGGKRRIDPDLATVAMKCLEKEPARRYQTVQSLADDLRRWRAGQPISARPPSTAYQLRKMIGRNRVGFALVVAAVVALVGAAVGMAVLSRHLAAERDRANREADAARANAAAFSRVLVQRNPSVGARRLDDPEAVASLIGDLDRTWEGRPDEEIDLLLAAGSAMFENGAFEAGIRFTERAASIERATHPDWPGRSTVSALGEMELRLGRASEAEALFRRIVDHLRSLPTPPNPHVLGYAVENLGCALRDLGRLDEADSLLHEALRLYETSKIPNPYYLASAHDSLGNLALARGDARTAEAEHRISLALRLDGGDATEVPSPRQSQSLHNLGVAILRQGRLDEAEPPLRRALAGREERLGPSHPDTAATLAVLADLEIARGRPQEAKAYLDRAEEVYRQRLPADHPARRALEREIEALDSSGAAR